MDELRSRCGFDRPATGRKCRYPDTCEIGGGQQGAAIEGQAAGSGAKVAVAGDRYRAASDQRTTGVGVGTGKYQRAEVCLDEFG